MTEIILMIAAGLAVFYGIRFYMLRRGVQDLGRELALISQQPEENRIVKLSVPQRDLEELGSLLNHILEQMQKERISFEKREREFQKQLEDLSHDLRTPLTAIQGYLKLIDQKKLGREEQEYLEVLERRARSLSHLTDQFYEFSTLLSGDYDLELCRMDLGRICREQLLGSFARLEEAGIEVSVQIPDRPVWILADENALSRIIGNLLQNAARYAKKQLAIEIQEDRTSDRDSHVTLIFANDAETLAAETVSRMFDRFYTGSHARNQGGTGLGLAISKRLAEHMGAAMTVEARETKTDAAVSASGERWEAVGSASAETQETAAGKVSGEGREAAERGNAGENSRHEAGMWLMFKTVFKGCDLAEG